MPARLSDRQVTAFRHFMACGSVSDAARRMMTAQPGVTRLLRELEHDVGFALFERVRGRLVPTPEARLFQREVERAWIGMEQLRETAERIRTRQLGGLRISAMPLLGMTFLPDVIAAFRATHPGAFVQLSNYRSAQVVDEVITQRCDLGLAIVGDSDERFETRRFTLPGVCVMPADHPLAARDMLEPEDFRGRELIVFETHDPLRQALERWLNAAGVGFEAVLEVSLALQAVRLVMNGQGIAVVDPINAAVLAGAGVVQRPIAGALDTDFCILTPREQPLSQLAQAFIALFEREYERAIATSTATDDSRQRLK
ncbi:LysR substrate-binding domain-containing protein [Kushneria phosphatilytica]|uniref:LysR family transcriptional regulator n=1 Tax=Kushneria phosphatilytica TaxID=657387 RepID=A0A1S1NT44_9GAMM|nr:LysR substrate-binding domain-containing protein [Kushneria phosphatilytica]OHV08462.1 hypothetical protein BH688_14280 [Kushneria phosphatilytica]QEL09892.1 LysR family transcriptional regulator [Kushneria phosphatilytica]